MSEQPPRSTSATGGPRSPKRPAALGSVGAVTALVIAITVALTSHGSHSSPPPLSTVPSTFEPSVHDASPTGQPASAPPSTASPTPVATSQGIVPGRTLSGVAGVGTDKAAAFGVWREKPVDVVVDYTGTRTWDGISQVKREGLLDRGLPSTVHRVFSVPLIPSDDGSTLERGANGEYDSHFQELARELIEGGQANATIRLGWEMTGNWFAWNGISHPDQWVGAFQKAVTAMRAVPGAQFTFDWTVALGNADPESMYPGDAYVDLIGADNYDASFSDSYAPSDHQQVWNGILTEKWGLDWLADFAGKHGKRMSMGEWGVTQREDGHGGGDDPYFIEQMHAWFASHDVAYEAYFESTDASVKAVFAIDGGHFPDAAERYKQLFGGTGATGVPSATPPSS
jgi:hypothetical protein